MGTILRIEQVCVEDSITIIHLRTCRYKNTTYQAFNSWFLNYESSYIENDTSILFKLYSILFTAGEFRKLAINFIL